MNIKNMFDYLGGLYFLNKEKNIMEGILKIKEESIKKGNLKIFALGFSDLIKSKILETNRSEYGCKIIFLRKENKKISSKDYKEPLKLDCEVVLINLNTIDDTDKKNIKRLFESGSKVIVFSRDKDIYKDFLGFYKKNSENLKENLNYINSM